MMVGAAPRPKRPIKNVRRSIVHLSSVRAPPARLVPRGPEHNQFLTGSRRGCYAKMPGSNIVRVTSRSTAEGDLEIDRRLAQLVKAPRRVVRKEVAKSLLGR